MFKNIRLLAVSAALCILVGLANISPVYAFSFFSSSSETEEKTEEAEETEEETEDENGYVAPIIYGELKDGLFVRTFQEDLDSIEGGTDNPYYLQEYAKIVKARSLGELTPEMEADGGYVLVGDMVMMQEDLDAAAEDGDAGQGVITEEEVSENYGFLTIVAEVEDTLSDDSVTCYVGVMNDDTGEYFEFDLLAINSYTTTAQKVTAGTYSVVAGGVPDDYTYQYSFDTSADTFEIQSGGSALIHVTIGDVDGSQAERLAEQEAERAAREAAEAEQAAQEAEEEAAREKAELTMKLITAVVIVVVLAVIITIILLMRRAKNNRWS